MSCTICRVCGSNAPCSCGSARSSTSLCGTCGNGLSNCNCGNMVPANPTPYYQCVPSCQESNVQRITIQQFESSLKVINSWNIPTCGGSSVLTIPGLIGIVVGSYLWNPTYGYFEVTAFDISQETVTVINHCNEGNAAPGTQVPSCTEFVNVDPPVDTSDSGNVCVAIDFTAPAVSDCIDITLTSTTGITAGDVVQIGSGFYRVSAVKPNDIITICNDGDGITPGTSVIARDSAGNYNYCLEIISTSPCDRDNQTIVTLIGCHDSLTYPLEGPFPSDPDNFLVVPSLVNSDDVNASYVPIDAAKLRCTTLRTALGIITGTSNYTLQVVTSVGFGIGDILQIPGLNLRLTVTGTSNSAPGTLTVTTSDVPSQNLTYAAGTAVCVISCCENLQGQIDDIVGLPVASWDPPGVNLLSATLDSGNTAATSAVRSFAPMTNPSAELPMTIAYHINAQAEISCGVANSHSLQIAIALQMRINSGAWVTIGGFTDMKLPSPDAVTYGLTTTIAANGVAVVAAVNSTTQIDFRLGFLWFGFDTSSYVVVFTDVFGTLEGFI